MSGWLQNGDRHMSRYLSWCVHEYIYIHCNKELKWLDLIVYIYIGIYTSKSNDFNALLQILEIICKCSTKLYISSRSFVLQAPVYECIEKVNSNKTSYSPDFSNLANISFIKTAKSGGDKIQKMCLEVLNKIRCMIISH